MSPRSSLPIVGPALLALVALAGPPLVGTAAPPSVAPTSAQLLPPGAEVQEVVLAGGGFARALEIGVRQDGIRVRSAGGWRELSGVRAAGAPRSERLWLGSDQQGRDVLARIVRGARTSLLVALLATGIAVVVGTCFGLAAATAREPLRGLLVVTTDGLLGLPRLLLLLMLAITLRTFPGGLPLAIGLASWMEVARLVEAEARRTLGLPFVAAARGAGAGALRVASRHLLPNALPILSVAAPLVATEAILVEATLSFLGVAGAGDTSSWGRIVADGQRLLPSGWWMILFPGLFLCAAALAVHGLSRGRARSPRGLAS